MKIIIFAGGTGRRLWPISRQKSPKQFEPILGDKSTLQLAVDRVKGTYGPENIFISTNLNYVEMVRAQLPELPPQNVIGEPERRDLAAAVGLAMVHLGHATADEETIEPVAILWGDNYMEHVNNFRDLLTAAEELLLQEEAKILFVGETPRFANENLGWLGLSKKEGEINDIPYHRFEELRYRPPKEECEQMLAEKSHVWNTGYFVTTISFVQEQYRQRQPEMWQTLSEIEATIGTDAYEETLKAKYSQLAEISFDDAVLQYVDPDQALVLYAKMGWSDPGTLYALKEAINSDPEANVTQGLVVDKESKDCLVYNYESDKLVVAAGLEGMIVVNTEDAILVVHKDDIPLVKKIVNSFEGTDLESYS